MPEQERRARLAAVRGIFAARDNQFETAAFFFAEALKEVSIVLEEVPGFWGCSRSGMYIAVEAYEEAGRLRESTSLAAIIRSKYRPRPIRQRPTTTRGQLRRLQPKSDREAVSGSGD